MTKGSVSETSDLEFLISRFLAKSRWKVRGMRHHSSVNSLFRSASVLEDSEDFAVPRAALLRDARRGTNFPVDVSDEVGPSVL